MGIHDGREIIGRVDRHSRATDRAAFGSRRRNRFGSVLFLIFLRRVRFRRTDGRTERAIAEEGFKTRIVDQFFWGLSSRPIDSIRSDPIRPDRSFASGSLRASSNRDARGFRLIEVNKNLRARRDAVPSARSVVVDVDVRASERSRSRERFDSVRPRAVPSRVNRRRVGAGAGASRVVSFDPRGRPRARRFGPSVRSLRSFARRSRRVVTHPIRRSVDPS